MVDPIMESELYDFIIDYNKEYNKYPSKRDVIEFALTHSNISEFKASKGWLDKFFKRCRLCVDKFRIYKRKKT